ncbi:MAG: single-stranded-DNA-specific exonuclease RecJ [Alphaproteobacteria bacterium]|jgi:single-stranded-DNA-specific exonuclease|nr:single-stranded-DNA-specific exonuclease RecJ [Alphaproteobacteria bacterium]MDP6516864.1 single-stranded-DNA-specific exonuclease RecJ [Alphaproteobacteria bacterium]
MGALGDGAPVLGVEQSLTGRRWRSRLADDRAALAITQAAGVPEIVGRLLAARGVSGAEAQDYLEPRLRDLMPDPSSLRDMDEAAARLAEAIAAGEMIAIFGDYDVDGATSAALLARYLGALGAGVRVYIPDRVREGYGPNLEALKRLRQAGAALAVTVDCGISAHRTLAAVQALGLDVIVVDHHLAEPRLPACRAVVDPNRLDDDSGLGMLAAVGVTLLLVVALNRRLRAAGHFSAVPEPDIMAWLDLVALGTVCDVVPLIGLNRALVVRGLEVMAGRRNVGLAALADVAGLESRPNTYHAGFVLGPRINAGGRVGQADLGYRLLATEDAVEAAALARDLERHNRDRQAIEAMTVAEAMAQVDALGDRLGPIALAVGQNWHPGVIGLVASRLAERFDRPALVIALDGETGKGSARSVPGTDIGAAITAARQSGLLINGGGHAMAAGLTVARAGVTALSEFLAQRVGADRAHRPPPGLGIDGALTLAAADRALVDCCARAGPFGSGNPEPRFAFAAARVVHAKVVGAGHVRCVLADGHGGRLAGIAFRAADSALGRALLGAGGSFHVAGHLRPDDWRGRHDVQLSIDDAAAAG